MQRWSRVCRSTILGVGVVGLLSGCDPIPGKILNKDQKKADMLWLYSQFDENYAPLEYKVERFGFDYEDLKSLYLQNALETQTNEDFYLVMQNFIAQFRDAHTTGMLTAGALPNRAKVAYLGFSGRRLGNSFVVTELLPTSSSSKSRFPIQVGDEIIEMDGMPLTQIIQEQLVQLEDLGQDEANLTFHMNRIFNRISTSSAFPKEQETHLKINKRKYSDEECKIIEKETYQKCSPYDKKEVELNITLPWIVKDLYDFRKEQKEGLSAVKSQSSEPQNISSRFTTDFFKLVGNNFESPIVIGLQGFDGSLAQPLTLLSKMTRKDEGYHFMNTFYFPNQIESWTTQVVLNDDSDTAEAANASSLALFKKTRYIPSDATFITSLKASFPTYVTREPVESSDGKIVGTRAIATMYLNTFSPSGGEEKVLAEFEKTLHDLAVFGVDALVIDLVNNGGGSLSLGMKLAQALSNQKVVMPKMQFRISETWLNEFETESLYGQSDAERELGLRVFKQLKEDQKAGKRLSTPVSAETLIPFELTPNEKLENPFTIVLLVNEMCASMCDIFSGIMQDNELAIILGSRTMGAGGNVVSHFLAPNSHLILRQTESLIVRSDADETYIENNGVTPDIQFPVNEFSSEKYRQVREVAIELLTKLPEPEPASKRKKSSKKSKKATRTISAKKEHGKKRTSQLTESENKRARTTV